MATDFPTVRRSQSRLPKQLAAAGNQKPAVGGGTSYGEFVLPSMGDGAIGHGSALQYSAALGTPRNTAFVKEYRAKYGKVPSWRRSSSRAYGRQLPS